MSSIQSLLFKKEFYTKKDVKKFLKDNPNFKPIKELDEPKNNKYFRQRLITPNYKKFNYRFHTINDKLDCILQIPKSKK